MKRRIFIIILIILATILGVFYSLPKKSSPSVVNRAPTSAPPLNTSFLPTVPGGGNEQYTNIPILTFRTQLPLYSFSNEKNMNQVIKTISSAFDYTGALTTIGGARSTYYSGSSDNKSIIIGEKPITFSHDVATLSGSIVSKEVSWYESALSSFVYSKGLVSPSIKINTSNVSYLSPEGTTPHKSSPRTATVIQIDFEYLIDSVPIFINNAVVSGITARFDGANTLIQLRGYLLPTISKTQSTIKIISYKDAVVRLTSNRGVLTSVTIANDNEMATEEAPKQIKILKVRLGYLYDYSEQRLAPVFIFLGSGLTDSKKEVLTTTVVSAIP